MKNGMKQTEIGEIPVEWEVVALQDIAQRVKTKDAGGEHEVLTISAKVGFVRQEDRYSRYMAGESVKNYTLLKQGQFSYNKGNSLTYPFGCIYRLDDYTQALVPNVYISFELNDTADADFCRHLFLEGEFISRLKPFITSGVRGNGLLNVNAEDFFSLKLALPPLPEQRKIAEILSTLDEKMAVMDEQLAQTQELKKGLMQRLLTKGIGHTQFKDSPLGEIPESWEAVQLKDVAKFTNGKGHENCIVDDGDYIVVNSKFISSDASVSKRSDKCLAPLLKGQIAMVMSDVPSGKAIAKCFLVDANNRYTLNQRICAIEAVQADAKYLFYILNRNPYYLEFDNGISQTNLRKEEVLHCPVPLPPLPEQRQIAEILTTVDEKIGVLQDKKAQYQTLKRGLMQQLLTGQRRVRVPALETAALL